MTNLEKKLGIFSCTASLLLISFVLIIFIKGGVSLEDIEVIFWIYGALFILLLVLITRRVLSVLEFSRIFPGGSLNWKLISFLASMLLLPMVVIIPLSFGYFNAELKKYFEDDLRRVESNSLLVSQIYLNEQKSALMEDMMQMRKDFLAVEAEEMKLRRKAKEHDLSYLALVKGDGKVLQESEPSSSRATELAGTDMISFGDEAIYGSIYLEDGIFLVVEKKTRKEFVAMVKDNRNAISALEKSRIEAVNLAGKVKFIFLYLLALLALALLWSGLTFSTWITDKVAVLLHSTHRISKGDLKWRIPNLGKNEFNFLGESLNHLLEKLTERNRRLKTAQLNAEKRNQFIEAMLNGVSSGIICLNEQDKIHLMNNSASSLLVLDKARSLGESILSALPEIGNFFPHTKSFQMELIRKYKRIFLLVNVGEKGEIALLPGGRVITMEDITLQIEAQKEEIWTHIARSLAHEIKNPLTPIQLSAERLMSKYSPQSEKERQDFFTSINSIIKQVKIIQEMVDSFSSFARMPRLKLEKVDLTSIIAEAVSLHRSQYSGIEYEILAPTRLNVQCDFNAMNRVLFNLLKNASQALNGVGKVVVSADWMDDHSVCLQVKDNGKGFPPDLLHNLTKPYVTTKKGGSGFGLAIVNRVAEAHKGILILENVQDSKGQIKGAIAKLVWKGAL